MSDWKKGMLTGCVLSLAVILAWVAGAVGGVIELVGKLGAFLGSIAYFGTGQFILFYPVMFLVNAFIYGFIWFAMLRLFSLIRGAK